MDVVVTVCVFGLFGYLVICVYIYVCVWLCESKMNVRIFAKSYFGFTTFSFNIILK